MTTDHQAIVPPWAGRPWCTCGYVGGNGIDRPLLADHLREYDRRMTPQGWCEFRGIRILDPDGWRSANAPDWDEPITEAEFDERAAVSTSGPWNWPAS